MGQEPVAVAADVHTPRATAGGGGEGGGAVGGEEARFGSSSGRRLKSVTKAAGAFAATRWHASGGRHSLAGKGARGISSRLRADFGREE